MQNKGWNLKNCISAYADKSPEHVMPGFEKKIRNIKNRGYRLLYYKRGKRQIFFSIAIFFILFHFLLGFIYAVFVKRCQVAINHVLISVDRDINSCSLPHHHSTIC